MMGDGEGVVGEWLRCRSGKGSGEGMGVARKVVKV